mgnify:CR=1 FL=1|jgi:hypothetical protein
MPEGDLRDLYGVVRRVSSGRWRSGVRLTAEQDGEALEEKYGEKWLGRSATGHPKPPKVPSEAGTSAEAVAPESDARDDVSRQDEDDSGRPEESGKESQTEPATRDDLEDLLREAESWGVAPETDAAEAAKAVLEAEVARAEAQAKQEAAAVKAQAEARAKQEADAAKAQAEARAKQEADAAKAKADEAAAAARAEVEAQAKLPEKPRLARLQTSHDSFSSMPATSPPASDDGAPEAKAKAALEPLPEPVASKEPRFAKLRVALSRAAEIAKDAPFAKLPPMSPRTLRRAETALWKLGCFCGGFLGVLVLSSVKRAPTKRTAPRKTRKPAPDARAPTATATEDSRLRGGRTDVASPRILKEVFSP